MSSIFLLTSVTGTGVYLGGVVPARWTGFLLTDLDERNEIIGAARGGLLIFRQFEVNLRFPPRCQE